MSYGYVLAAAFVILIGGLFMGRWSAVKYPAELDVGDYVMISNCNMSNVKLILPKDGLKGFTMSNNLLVNDSEVVNLPAIKDGVIH